MNLRKYLFVLILGVFFFCTSYAQQTVNDTNSSFLKSGKKIPDVCNKSLKIDECIERWDLLANEIANSLIYIDALHMHLYLRLEKCQRSIPIEEAVWISSRFNSIEPETYKTAFNKVGYQAFISASTRDWMRKLLDIESMEKAIELNGDSRNKGFFRLFVNEIFSRGTPREECANMSNDEKKYLQATVQYLKK
jgi:hypothetical protein